MNPSFFAGLFLAWTTGGVSLPPGTGYFQQTLGDPNQVVWGLPGGIVSGAIGGTNIGPGPCMATCAFNFTTPAITLPVAFAGEYIVIPTFRFTGPTVNATAICTLCIRPPNVYETFWGPVPITMTGVVHFLLATNPSQSTEVSIAGSGTARAENHYDQQLGPWNYSLTRYDFRYDIVPEPDALLLMGAGFVMLGTLVRFTRTRSNW